MDTSMTRVRALLIEDNEDDTLLLVSYLKKAQFELLYQRVDTPEQLDQALLENWDLILSDYSMPRLSGQEALRRVRQIDPDVPFFYVSGTLGEERAVEAIRQGAQDYFIKGNLQRLPMALKRELTESLRRREHRLSEQRIYHLANFDSLTDLPNRSLFNERLAQAFLNAKSGQNMLLCIVDLDRFQNVNDSMGSLAGDRLLVQVAQRLSQRVGKQDTLARLSADEFALIFPTLAPDQSLEQLANQILSIFAAPFSLWRYEVRVQASMGYSQYPQDADSVEELIGNAMMALHHAKNVNGNSHLPYRPEMRMQLQERLLLEQALEQAVEHQQFFLHYQPQVSLANRRIVGVEALIRWQKPGNGVIGPVDFIPASEESGLIVPIGQWALREACRQIRLWHQAGFAPLRVAVNVSAFQFRQRGLVQMVRDVLDEFEVLPEWLEVEITETTLMQDTSLARSILSSLHDMGISIALDDFGTGYSSLSYLKRFPVDLLKIDRAFVKDLPGDADDAAIVQAIIAMADKLGVAVIAEGVETQQQLDFLQQNGCAMVQGYYLQRPLAAAKLEALLADGPILPKRPD